MSGPLFQNWAKKWKNDVILRNVNVITSNKIFCMISVKTT